MFHFAIACYTEDNVVVVDYLGPVNSSPPEQYGRHFADDIFKCIFLNEKCGIFIRVSLKFLPKGPIWEYVSIGSGDGFAPNRRQVITWTNADHFTIAYMRHNGEMS